MESLNSLIVVTGYIKALGQRCNIPCWDGIPVNFPQSDCHLTCRYASYCLSMYSTIGTTEFSLFIWSAKPTESTTVSFSLTLDSVRSEKENKTLSFCVAFKLIQTQSYLDGVCHWSLWHLLCVSFIIPSYCVGLLMTADSRCQKNYNFRLNMIQNIAMLPSTPTQVYAFKLCHYQ